MNKWLILLLIPVLAAGIFFRPTPQTPPAIDSFSSLSSTLTPNPTSYQTIKSLKNRSFTASEIRIEQTLKPGTNYQRFIASYQSDGLKIYGLFTVPTTTAPSTGFPSIIILHGYLEPKTYQTTERYIAYQDGFARNGFITFKPDLRGHGRSDGQPVNSNFSQNYVIDTLNLISALKVYKNANPKLIGLWGHSNGGSITLRSLEVSTDIQAAVIWAGVVGSYEDLLVTYRSKIPWMNNWRRPTPSPAPNFTSPDDLVKIYGPPNLTSPFWSQVDPYAFIQDISAPIQLHHGIADDSVPLELSVHLKDVLTQAGKTVEYYEYPNGDHNLSGSSFSPAMKRSVDFFKKNLR